MDELTNAVERWVAEHAPAHRGHHVQVGGGGVLCATCGLLDLVVEPDRVPEMAAV